jgi:hypothetical protein
VRPSRSVNGGRSWASNQKPGPSSPRVLTEVRDGDSRWASITSAGGSNEVRRHTGRHSHAVVPGAFGQLLSVEPRTTGGKSGGHALRRSS